MIAKTIEAKPLIIPRRLALFLGKSAAIFLQQLHYWLGRSKHLIEGVKWIYNSYQAWADQILMLSSSTIKRAVVRLKALQLIQVEQHSKSDCNHVNWYTIDYQRLEALLAAIGSNCTDRDAQIEQIELLKMTTSSLCLDPERSSQATTDSLPAAALEETEAEDKQPQQPPPHPPASPTPQPVQPSPEPSNPGGDMLSAAAADHLAQFSGDLIALGIEDNREVRAEMHQHSDRVANAIAYVRQKQNEGWVKNPTGLFRTALRQNRSPEKPLAVCAPPPPRFDFFATESACIMALQAGDRAFVQAKLQRLVESGLRPEVEKLLDRHRDWAFVLAGDAIGASPCS